MFNGCSCSSLSCSQGALEVEPGPAQRGFWIVGKAGPSVFSNRIFVWNFRMLWKVSFVSFYWQITWIYTPPTHRITNHHRDVVRFLGVGNPKLNLKKKLLECWVFGVDPTKSMVDFQRFFSAWLFETYPIISPWKLLLGRGHFSFAIWQMVPSCGCILHFFGWGTWVPEAYRQAKEKLRQSQGGSVKTSEKNIPKMRRFISFQDNLRRNCGCE